jgi:predicted ATP-dependent serine protease
MWPSWWKSEFPPESLETFEIQSLSATPFPFVWETGEDLLDSYLSGGLFSGAIFEITGAAGTGKTQLAL